MYFIYVYIYFAPISSLVIFLPSTIVNAPIPGKTTDFKISVPRPVAFITQMCAPSNAA